MTAGITVCLPQSTPAAPAAPETQDSKGNLQSLLTDWATRGWLRQLDTAFAAFLWSEVPDAPALLILAAALASHQLGRGHASLDLAATLSDPGFALSLPPEGSSTQETENPAQLPGEVLAGVTLAQWQSALEHRVLVSDGAGDTPLVRVGSRVYLRRYWQYERDVRVAIDRRLESSAALQAALPTPALRQSLAALFPPSAALGSANDWQKLACALAARSAFCIITGGPGTGKTTTVVKLLALLQALALAGSQAPAAQAEAEPVTPTRALRIRLAAPTGKAAARLNESIAGAVARLPLADLAHGELIRSAIPVKVSTLHRLLGSRPDTRHFVHHAGNPLAVDVLVVDEASMVDLEMMAAVLAALPASARLILLGDKDQLASVEAGAVLGELCRRAEKGHFTPATSDWLQSVADERIIPSLIDADGTALDQAVVMMRHSFRFAADSGIGQMAKAVNSGDTVAMGKLWKVGHQDLALLQLTASEDASLRELVIEGRTGDTPTAVPVSNKEDVRCGYRYYLKTLSEIRPAREASDAAFDGWARKVLEAHGQFQVLTALRRGPWGVDGLNQRIAHLLHEAALIPATEGWYLGRPVLVTRNDYGLGLMNGDIGITLARPGSKPADHDWNLRVAFPAGDGAQGIKWVMPSRLQSVETVYALTVHKSQGSEFTHTALILPDSLNPILTRELIYTGLTRAQRWLTLAHAGGAQVLGQAIVRQVLRTSGLMDSNGGNNPSD